MIKSKKYYLCNSKRCDVAINKLTSALVYLNKYIVCDKWCLEDLLIDLNQLKTAKNWEINNLKVLEVNND